MKQKSDEMGGASDTLGIHKNAKFLLSNLKEKTT
jgi:hypothetical protein